MKTIITSPQVKKAIEYVVAYRGSDILDFAKKQGWDDVRICGRGKMITSLEEHDSGWTLFPYNPSTDIIPSAALQRLKALEDAGITYQGLIITHEPKSEATAEPIEEERGDLFNKKWLKYAGIAGASVVLGPAVIVAVGAALVAGAVVLALGAASYFALGDPALVVVCDDETWIELYTWYE